MGELYNFLMQKHSEASDMFQKKIDDITETRYYEGRMDMVTDILTYLERVREAMREAANADNDGRYS